MTETSLVDHLWQARTTPHEVAVAPGSLSFEEALDVQIRVAERFEQRGDPIGGWKAGLTSGSARDMMGEGFRPFGFILAGRIFDSGTTIPLERFLNCRLEPEICLVLGRRLRGRVTPEDAREAVSGVAAAFELNELRVPGGRNADHPTLVADGMGNWGLVVGDTRPAGGFTVDGTTVELFRGHAGVGAATAGEDLVIDDPFVSLARLAALLSEHGCGLEAGQRVITGSFLGSAVSAPGTWTATFSGLGRVNVRFS